MSIGYKLFKKPCLFFVLTFKEDTFIIYNTDLSQLWHKKTQKNKKNFFIKSKGNHSNQTSGNNLKVMKVDQKMK